VALQVVREAWEAPGRRVHPPSAAALASAGPVHVGVAKVNFCGLWLMHL
jgi:hypothetical protein